MLGAVSTAFSGLGAAAHAQTLPSTYGPPKPTYNVVTSTLGQSPDTSGLNSTISSYADPYNGTDTAEQRAADIQTKVNEAIESDDTTPQCAQQLDDVAGGLAITSDILGITGDVAEAIGAALVAAPPEIPGIVIQTVGDSFGLAADSVALAQTKLKNCNAEFTGTILGDANLATSQGISAFDGHINLGNADGLTYQGGIALGGGSLSGAGTLGHEATTGAASAIAIGNDAVASSANSTALGDGAGATAAGATAIGSQAQASAQDAFAAGSGASAAGSGSVSLGANSTSVGQSAVAIGDSASASGDGATAIGASASALGNSTALGNGASTQGDGATALGSSSLAFAGGTAVGDSARAGGAQSTALGNSATTLGDGATALGASSIASNGATAVGESASARGAQSTALGSSSQAGGGNSTAVGDAALATGANSTALGASSSAIGEESVAIGEASDALGAKTTVVGTQATANDDSSMAVGFGSQATGVGSIALGANAQTTAENSVAIGQGSVADAANTVSVGSSSLQKRITNLADGTNSTDAVNVSQLQGLKASTDAQFAITNQNVANNTTNITQLTNGTAGPLQVNNTDNAAPPQATGTNALAAGPGATATASNAVALGITATAVAKESTVIGNAASATAQDTTVIGYSASATGINSVVIGANSTDGGQRDVVSVGSPGSTRRIVNLSDGVGMHDAVNVEQLLGASATTLGLANSYTDLRFGETMTALKGVQRNANAATASAMAIAAIPQTFEGGKSIIGVGTGTWDGQQAIAIGGSTASADGRFIFKLGATLNSRGDAGGAAGAGIAF